MTVLDYMTKLYPDDADDFSLGFRQVAEKIKLIIDEGMEDYEANTRRPYFRLRGKRVTEEQAFEIIRRTDRLSPWSDEPSCNDHFTTGHFGNNWTRNNLYPSPFGWVHPNGIVGVDGITGKYPDLEEFIDNCFVLIVEFPYLDFVVAVTKWDELPPYEWERKRNTDIDEWKMTKYVEYPDFLDNLEVGLWVHDGTIEVLSPERAAAVYAEYDKKYSEKDQRIYSTYYYMDFQPDVISDDFVARCYKAYGFDGIPETSEWLRKKRNDTVVSDSPEGGMV